MPVLTEEDRRDIWAQFMRENAEAIGITKQELRAVFNGADDYLDANATAMNAAIPQPARGALSSAQKAHVYQFVMALRYQRGV